MSLLSRVVSSEGGRGAGRGVTEQNVSTNLNLFSTSFYFHKQNIQQPRLVHFPILTDDDFAQQ